MLKNYNKHEDLGYERNVNIMEKRLQKIAQYIVVT